MNIGNRTVALAAWALGAAAGIGSSSAPAQITDDWRFTAIIYGYFPDIGGESKFPSRVGGASIDVDASTILNNLKFVFMGTFEAQKGRWGMFTDLMYLDVGGSKSQSRNLKINGVELPLGVTANANLDIKGTIWTLAGSYRVAADPTSTFDVLAGARLVDLKENLGWEFSADLGPNQPSRTGNSDGKASNWDAIAGVKGRLAFGANREWFVPYYLDVGTGESDLTWQAFAALGYSFKWGDIAAGWRYLDYEFKSSSNLEKVNFNGPMVGVAFHW